VKRVRSWRRVTAIGMVLVFGTGFAVALDRAFIHHEPRTFRGRTPGPCRLPPFSPGSLPSPSRPIGAFEIVAHYHEDVSAEQVTDLRIAMAPFLYRYCAFSTDSPADRWLFVRSQYALSDEDSAAIVSYLRQNSAFDSVRAPAREVGQGLRHVGTMDGTRPCLPPNRKLASSSASSCAFLARFLSSTIQVRSPRAMEADARTFE
jgi:hypothetical protein